MANVSLGEIESAPRFVDVRSENEYISDISKAYDIEEIRQRYQFTYEFLDQQLKCSHCGSPYRPRDNFARYGCAMHPGSIKQDRKANEFRWTCCGQTTAEAYHTVGCSPCVHTFKQTDFNDLVLPQKEYKNLPMEMVDILKPFPIDREMIVAENHRDGVYMFAMSQAQLNTARALAHPDRPAPNTKYEHQVEDDYGDGLVENFWSGTSESITNEEEEMIQTWKDSIRIAPDNWKIKILFH